MYWTDRLDKQASVLYDKTASDTEKQLIKYYSKAQNEIINDIKDLYDKLLEDAVDGKVMVNDLYKYDRYFALMNGINQKLRVLGGQEIKIYQQKFLNMYEGVQEVITKTAPSVISHSFVTPEAADKVLDSVWCADGKHWSQRVWDNKKALQETLENGLINCVVRGVSKSELVKEFKNDFGVGFRQADRIVRTELSHVQNQAAVDRYVAAGVKKYKILTAHDSRLSEICKEQSGKIYRIDEAVVGKTMPPFHPNCRSTIVPILEE